MNMQKLIGNECGEESSLARVTSHVTQNLTRSELLPGSSSSFIGPTGAQSGEDFVNEYLNEVMVMPNTFNMNDLLQSVRQVEHTALQPTSANMANRDWVREFLDKDAINHEPKPNEDVWLRDYNQWSQDIAHNPPLSSNVDEWESGFLKFLAEPQIGTSDLATKTQTNEMRTFEELEDIWKSLSENSDTWANEYKLHEQEYRFFEQNPVKDVANAFELGKEKLQQGDLPMAVLYFEAAAQQDSENAEVWKYLGKSHAKNEQDLPAIGALERSLTLNPSDLQALYALSISYTNENYQNHACATLLKWLKHNPKYGHIVPAHLHNEKVSFPVYSTIMTNEQHRTLVDLFLKAVQSTPNEIDADLQRCMGVLFNLSGDYDKAIDCFRTALQVRPQDANMYNSLGATLANSGRSEEAIHAYHQALTINPGLIRARYNVGISCINMKAYRQAVEHFLLVLNQQAKALSRTPATNIELNNSGTQMSNAVWNTLKMVGHFMRDELDTQYQHVDRLIDERNLNDLNGIFNVNVNDL